MIAMLYVAIFVTAAAVSYVATEPGVAFALWALLAPSSFNIVVYSGGTTFNTDSEMLAIFTAAMAVVLLAFTFAAATGRLRDRSQTRFGADT